MLLSLPNALASGATPALIRRLVAWVTGASLSSILIFAVLFVITIILRRKGYGVRLGVACVVLYARPGSRRFPNGVQVRCTTRIVGYLVGGCRGPWLDIYSDRFYMRLRPKLPHHPHTPRPWLLVSRFLSHGVAAVDRGCWSALVRNMLARVFAFIIRGLRVRVDKVRVWKDAGVWEYSAEQFVLSGRASGLFGSQYSLSVNDLKVNLCKQAVDASPAFHPINASIIFKRGFEITAHLAPRLRTLFRRRRLAILDDLRICFSAGHITCSAPHILEAYIVHIAVELCPGYSHSLFVKLPPMAPPSRRPRKPSILHYWEANGAIHSLSLRFTAPIPPLALSYDMRASSSMMSLPNVSENKTWSRDLLDPPPSSDVGVFLRLDSLRVDAYGKSGDERHDDMMKASVSLRGCSAGSSSVDALSHALYETVPTDCGRTEDVVGGDFRHGHRENIDKIVAARPEAMFWIEDVSAAVDVNCAKHHNRRVDFAGSGGVLALEPVGLVLLVNQMATFIGRYVSRSPRRGRSLSGDESDSGSTVSRSGSSSSLPALSDELASIRVVSELRHWTVLVLGRGPVGDGDTMAVVASTDNISLPQVDIVDSSLVRMMGSIAKLELMHWSRWARTTNVSCDECEFDIQRGPFDKKKVTLTKMVVDWDLDFHSGLEILPSLLSSLKELKPSSRPSDDDESGDAVWVSPPLPSGADFDRVHISEAERRERRDMRRSRLLDKLSTWELTAKDVQVTVSFPDGPKLGLSARLLPSFNLSTEMFVGHHVVLLLQDRKCAYAAEFKLGSPFHTMSKNLEKRSVIIDAKKLHIVLENESQFGFLLQDWLLRFRAAISILREARWHKRGMIFPKPKKRPMVDIHFQSSDVAIYFEDHPISSFLTAMLPLMQDEAHERVIREHLMFERLRQLRKSDRAQIAETPLRCVGALKKKDSDIWVKRVQQLKEKSGPQSVGAGYLPDLAWPPAATFSSETFCFNVVLDDLARQMGSSESIRRLKMLDDYELGSKKYNETRHYDRDAWNSIGFRSVDFEATKVSVELRDYPFPFLSIDRMYFENTTMGQAVQATKEPFVCEANVAIGRRRIAKIVKGLGMTKTFADIHLKVDTLMCVYNPSYLTGIVDFGRGVSRFFSGGRNPSPRIPWFDSLRVNMHGRMRLTARKFKGYLTSSTSPYSMTSHFAEIESDNFEMLTSRLEPSQEDPFPICWKLHNWYIRPSHFDEQRRSQILFEFVRVGLNPIISVNSGDAQDHYFVPFPTKEEVEKGGPGIGKGTTSLVFTDEPVGSSDNGFGSYTDWHTGLHNIPGHDSYYGFKTRSIVLGIDVTIRHPKPHMPCSRMSVDSLSLSSLPNRSKCLPQSASIVYSDALSTLTKVIRTIVNRPMSCRLPPRWVSLQRKPPSETGLSTSLQGLQLSVDARDVNVTLHNNLEQGHALFISIDSLNGELWKETDVTIEPNGDIRRVSRMTRRRFDIVGLFSSVRVPGLDMAVDDDDMGKLLTVDKISLSDSLHDEMRYLASPRKTGGISASSGFGSDGLDDSPFYTFSATHPLQRGNPLDKVQYDKRLLIDRVRLIWSPVRRISVFAWPDAFKVKTFCMKAPRANFHEEFEHSEVHHRLDGADLPRKEAGLLSRSAMGSSVFDELMDGGMSYDNADTGNIPDIRLSQSRISAELSLDANTPPHGEDACDSSFGLDGRPDESLDESARSPWLRSPVMPLSRSKVMVKRKHVGSMVDLLLPPESRQSSFENNDGSDSSDSHPQKEATCGLDVLETTPKFALYINDCEVVFGSPETIGHVFLTSKAVRVGIVDKCVQKAMQLGEANERWVDREYRFHLDAAEVFTRDKEHGEFNFNIRNWVPRGADHSPSMALVTQKPICMDLMYITSSSLPSENDDEEDEDHTLRPSLLFINIPDIKLSTNACEFHSIIDVVRKVLMQRMRASEVVNEELSSLRYKLQLAGGKVSSEDLEQFMRRLNSVTRQFLYAGDTFRHELVSSLLLPNESFAGSLMRYKAKAKALATYLRKDQRATTTDVLYPTMYISYSFDNCSWELREACSKEGVKGAEDAFVEITLQHLVCRHIFYVGRGSSTEITFANISAQNKMRSSYFQRILQPASSATSYGHGEKRKPSGIKASDGAAVSFRWYSTQEDRVGGIPVYELLTIQVAPMTAAVTRKLYNSVTGFVFSHRGRGGEEDKGVESGVTGDGRRSNTLARAGSSVGGGSNAFVAQAGSFDSGVLGGNSSRNLTANAGKGRGKLDDVSQMAQRGESNMLFKYVFIDAFELTASYKNKETTARGAFDFFDLFVRTPSFSYSSQVWTWKAFSTQIRRDLVKTFFLRGASGLAKIKLLPGYSRAKRRLVKGADTVRDSIYSRLPTTSSGVCGDGASECSGGDREVVHDGIRAEESEDNVTDLEDDPQGTIDAAVADICGAEDSNRQKVLAALYGTSAVAGAADSGGGGLGVGRSASGWRTRERERSQTNASESNGHEGMGFRKSIRAVVASGRSRTASSHSHTSTEEGGKGSGMLSRLRRKAGGGREVG